MARFNTTVKLSDNSDSSADEEEREEKKGLNFDDLNQTSELTTYIRNVHRFAAAPPLPRFQIKEL